MRVNLAQEEQLDISFSWLRVAGIVVVCVILAAIAVDYYMLNLDERGFNEDLDTIEEEIEHYQPLRMRAERLTDEIGEMEDYFDRAVVEYYWDRAVREIGYIVPESTLVEYLNIEEDEMEFGGITADSLRLLNLIHNLEESDAYGEIRLDEMSKQEQVNFVFDAVMLEEGGD